jgi:hypothetical protein
MIFFGWGTKVRDVAIDATHHLRVARSFAHVFFVFTVTGSRTFVLAELGDAGWAYRRISDSDAAALFGGTAPDIDPWWRFSLLGLVGLAILGGMVSSIF